MDKEVLTALRNNDLYSELANEQELTVATSKTSSDEISIPDYLQQTYHWSYLNPRNVLWLDQEWIVKLILWGQHNKLRKAALSEIISGDSVLQAAAVYGDFSKALSQHISSKGNLKVIDVAKVQVDLTKQKLKNFLQTKVELADASTFRDSSYEVIWCYFLLHEIPDDIKTKVLDNLLGQIKPNGKLVIVDYHKPHILHPVRPITSLVFKFLEPFARSLWKKPLLDFASEPDSYQWQQQKYFGGLFQKIVISKQAFKEAK
jgi:ubiquinone/menaquinone biosynthesis C-methylase UbiE